MIRRGLVLPRFVRGTSGKFDGKDLSTPAKKLSYLWLSLQSLLLLNRFSRWGERYCRKRIYGRVILGASVQAIMDGIGLGQLKNVKLTVLLLGILNLAILATGILVAVGTSNAKCSRNLSLGAVAMSLGAALRLVWFLGMGFAQANTASTMIEERKEALPSPISNITRRQRRSWYMRWLWWSRFGIIMTIVQLSVLVYYTWFLARNTHWSGRHATFCPTGDSHLTQKWVMALMVALPAVGGSIVFAQCCVGSDVLAWRLLYGAHYEAWRAHYRQMFDYGIREVLCCLGRRRYMSVLEEDEVDSVSTLLGDLVAYRAAGASHLEVIAGVALLRQEGSKKSPVEEFEPAPNAILAEAAILHPYAVAAYTGPLLDVGRHPLTFPCAWLYRQGVLKPWNWRRYPSLEGDNWWRGHAAAFLTHAQLPPEALKKGRVLQTNRESVYFVVVLKELRYVLVAVRGTETPEDLITDGLGRECALTKSDLRGILENNLIPERVKQDVLATMPHFGHVGVIEAAIELSMQLDNLAEDDEKMEVATATNSLIDNKTGASMKGSQPLISSKKTGLLSSLLGPGGECEGYSLRLVGHSLGGAIATLAGLRLASRFPHLHVYAFGVLPCVDLVTAEAISSFTTSIIYNDEFSSRLSVAAILRLRAAALRALAQDTNTDSALVAKITRRFFRSKSQPDLEAQASENQSSQPIRHRYSSVLKGGAFLCSLACRCMAQMPQHSSIKHTSIELESFRQDYQQDYRRDVDNDTCGERASPFRVAATSENSTGTSEGVVYEKQVSKDREMNGVSLPDGEGVGIDAGSEINEEEAVALMGSGPSEREGHGEDGHHEGSLASFELLDNGMPKDNALLAPAADLQELWPAEMFVPGLIIHLVRIAGSSRWFSLPKSLTFSKDLKVDERPKHIAVLKDRKHFRDILVSPAMFLDHMPWKCQYALNEILGQLNTSKQRHQSLAGRDPTHV